jgi:MoaA/NifB/PqqE/SkfB family radical SAM enzyme
VEERLTDTTIFDINPWHVLTLCDRARQARAGKIPNPRMAIIYPNYGCNHYCVGCEYAAVNRENPVQMKPERLLRLLEELRETGVDSVEFCGGGEPTIYPHLEEAILHGRKLGLSFGLLTNGSGIQGSLAETVAREVSYVRISLDAATAGTYSRVRRPTGIHFDGILDTIRQLKSRREVLQSPLLVSIKYLVSKVNREEIPAVFGLAADLGVDSLQFKALRQSPQALSPQMQDDVANEIRTLRAMHPGLKVLGGVDKAEATCRCWLTPLQTMIDARGDVLLCCYYLHRRERHRIGNIHRKPFREIWGSPRHIRAIAGIRPSECNLLDCRFIGYMKILEPILSDPGHQVDFI